jgi:hypothetical protein
VVQSWEDTLAERSVDLEFLEINRQSGEFSSYVLWGNWLESHEIEGEDKLIYDGTQALQEFFSFFDLEFRDVVVEKTERPDPLDDLVRLKANLVPIDPIMPLEEVLTEDVVAKLDGVGRPFCTTTARATLEPIYHRDILVNWGVTLRPCEGEPAFKVHPNQSKGRGTSESPLRQDDGSVYFVLKEPFSKAKHIEIDLGADAVCAILMEVKMPA